MTEKSGGAKRASEDSGRSVLGIGIFLAVAYFALIALVLSPCNSGSDAAIRWIPEFRCGQINLLGDFLAGVFAPPAFLMLAIAVFLQSRELGLQRRELEETRGVLESQAVEARRSAEYIGGQTTILRAQELREKQHSAAMEIDRLQRLIIDDLSRHAIAENVEVHLGGYMPNVNSHDGFDDGIRKANRYWKVWLENTNSEGTSVQWYLMMPFLDRLERSLESIEKLAEQLSESGRSVLDLNAIAVMRALITATINSPRTKPHPDMDPLNPSDILTIGNQGTPA